MRFLPYSLWLKLGSIGFVARSRSMPTKRSSAAKRAAKAALDADHAFAAAVERLLRLKARVPVHPWTGEEAVTPQAALTRLGELATFDTIEQITDSETEQ